MHQIIYQVFQVSSQMQNIDLNLTWLLIKHAAGQPRLVYCLSLVLALL